MQNFNQLPPNIPLDPLPHHPSLHSLPSSDLQIRDKLSTHVKKRIMSNSSPVQVQGGTDSGKIGKGPKRVKKDATGGDSEPNCSAKDEEKLKASEKHVHKPDILTSILNEKKASLMRDPQVIEFLKKFNQELRRERYQK